MALKIASGAKATPVRYTLGGLIDAKTQSAFASFDGSGAAGAFLPSLAFYSSDGLLIARTFPSVQVGAGGSADVTFAPFLATPATQGAGNLNLLFSTTLAADTATVTISGISQAYHNLQLIINGRTSFAGAVDSLYARWNGDNSASYDYAAITYPTDSGINLGNAFGLTYAPLGEVSAAATDVAAFSICEAIIGGYARSDAFKFTTSRSTDTKYPAAVFVITTFGSIWRQKAPITSMIIGAPGGDLKAGTSIVLYGL